MRWRDGALSDLAVFQRGFDITRAEQRDGPYPVVSSSGITSYHDSYKVDGPGVVIGRKGSLGTVHYVDGPYWPHDTSLWVKDFRGNEPRFVYYFVQTMGFERFNVGGANPTLNRNHIHALPIRYPEPEQQRRIVDVLALYDDLITANTRRTALLEESVHLLYREWFGRLRFPGHEWTAVGNGVPDGWRRGRFADLVTLVNERLEPDEINATVPYVGLEHIPRRSLALQEWGSAADVTSTKLRFVAGDILFGKIRPYFHKVVVAPLDGIASSDALVFRASEQHHFGLTVAVASSSGFVEHASTTGKIGTRMPRADWSTMADYPVLLPPEPLAREFSEYVRVRTDLIGELAGNRRAANRSELGFDSQLAKLATTTRDNTAGQRPIPQGILL